MKPGIHAAFLTFVALNADMSVVRSARYRVSGSVIDSRTGQPATSGEIQFEYRTPTEGTSGTSRRVSGSFEFPNVIPGIYTVRASMPDETSASRQRALGPSPTFADEIAAELAIPMGRISVPVTGSVDNLVVTISPPGVLEGRLTVNGEPPSSLPNRERLRLGLWPSDTGGVLPWGPSTQVLPDGTFRFEAVPAAEYKLGMTGLPVGYYIDQTEISGVDMLRDALTFPSPSAGTLNVVLQRGTGSISGTATDSKSIAASGVEVVLIPEQRRRLDLYKTAITNKNGRFTIEEIPPGNYRLFSWEALEPYGYYDADVLSRDEARSTAVRVSAFSNNAVDVRLNEFEGR